jgi:hypothetical protein
VISRHEDDGGMFRKRRQYRAFVEAMDAEIARVRPVLEASALEIDRAIASLRDEFRTAPGMCPRCGHRMILRTARRRPWKGQKFWGCSRYPDCTETRSRENTRTVRLRHET